MDPGECVLSIGQALSSLVVSRDMSFKVGFEPQGPTAPSANMPFRPDFVKVLILRDMELGQSG